MQRRESKVGCVISSASFERLERRELMAANPAVNPAESIGIPLADSVTPGIHANLHLSKSSTASITQPAAPVFTAKALSGSQVNLNWKTVSGANGYIVDEWIKGSWMHVAQYMTNAKTSDTITGLTAGGTYNFKVGAFNNKGTHWAASTAVTTIQAVPTSVIVDNPAADVAYAPAKGSLFGPGGPSYLDVEQGAVGDCWYLASLAEVAARVPGDITSMFTPEGTTVDNGSKVDLYRVRFFNTAGVAEYVTVDTELPAAGGYYDHPANGVLWVALAEKAYAEANGQGIVSTQEIGTDSYSALEGGYADWGLQAITGKPVSDFSVDPESVASAWTAGQLIVLATYSPSSSYIVPDHCYAVVGYNASSVSPFTVYNPWGTTSSGWALGTYNGQSVYGQYSADMAFMTLNFSNLSIGTGNADAIGTEATITQTTSTTFATNPFLDERKHSLINDLVK